MTAPRRRDWGESAALLVCVLLFNGLPNRYTIGTPIVGAVLGIVVGTLFLLSVYTTIVGERKLTRGVMLAAAVIMAGGVALSLSKIVHLVIYEASKIDGVRLIETAVLIWVSNIVVFAIIYHLLGERHFVFPRPEGQPANQPMAFLDYIFLSFTTGTAFSPTDTAPLTTTARMYMMVESLVSLVVIAIAAARAINVL